MPKKRKTNFWLVGPELPNFGTTELPVNRSVLAAFLYQHVSRKDTVSQAASIVADMIGEVWNTFSIKTQIKKRVKAKILTLFNKWTNLKKNVNRNTECEILKRSIFKNSLDKLFDIGGVGCPAIHSDDARMILSKQRNSRNIRKIILNMKKTKAPENSSVSDAPPEQGPNDLETDIPNSQNSHVTTNSASSDQNDSSFSSPQQSTSHTTEKQKRIQIVDTGVASVLDRTKISDRNSALVLSVVAHSLGHDINNVSISRSTVKRIREANRVNITAKIKESFHPTDPLTVHWDGKILPEITGTKKVDRLPILVTCSGEEQLLAVPKLENGCGKTIGTAVKDSLLDWNLQEKVKAMCFDTTASNTGHKNGAAAYIELLLGKQLLHLSCRHHILEIVLEDVFKACMGPSSGPDILLFTRFKISWDSFKDEKFKTALDNHHTAAVTAEHREEIRSFATKMLQSGQPRDDYKELLQLVIMFLGSSEFTLKAPGATHRARWMAKAIYALKIWMFQDYFHLTPRELKAIQRICIFVSVAYVRFWYSANKSTSAPRNDVEFLQILISYSKIDKEVATRASNKFRGHLWYLSEELVCLALFDDQVSVCTKKKIVQAFKRPETQSRTFKASVTEMLLNQMHLEDFASEASMTFFKILNCDTSFLEKDPLLWEADASFLEMKRICQGLRVVNDVAERGVALMQEYNSLHTANEEQKQYLLQIVHRHRKVLPTSTKKAIATSLLGT